MAFDVLYAVQPAVRGLFGLAQNPCARGPCAFDMPDLPIQGNVVTLDLPAGLLESVGEVTASGSVSAAETGGTFSSSLEVVLGAKLFDVY